MVYFKPMGEVMRIGELASVSGLAAHTIRFYESRGLLNKPRRSVNGYRIYDESALQSLSRIQCAQRLGFSLEDMLSVMAGNGTELGMDHEKMLAQLDMRLIEVDTLLEQLTRQKQEIVDFKIKLQVTWDQGECMQVDDMNKVNPKINAK
jgi:MerR family copper efflux transcriptional regulator